MIVAQTQPIYHVLPDLTALVYAVGGFIVAMTGLLALLLPAINRLKNDMTKVRDDTAKASSKADVATRTAETAQNSVDKLGDKVFQIAKDSMPPTPVQASTYLPPKDGPQ